MKSPRLWLLLMAMFVAVLALQPAGELLIRTEVQRRTGSRLSMEKCSFNLLTGGILVKGARVEPCVDRDSIDQDASSPMSIAKIWAKGSLSQLLYRKLATPTTIMDGVALGLSKSDEKQVPSVRPVTQMKLAQQILLAPQPKPVSTELDQVFQKAQRAYRENLSNFAIIDRQVEGLEKRSLQVENPLRDREMLLDAQRTVASLQRELKDYQGLLEQNRESFIKASSAMPLLYPDQPYTSSISLGSAIDEVSLQNDAKCLTEQLVCSIIAQMKPYLGLSHAFVSQWLVTLRDSGPSMQQGNAKMQSGTERGVNYRFGLMNENEILFKSIHMRGSADIEAKQLPFSGLLRNVGSQRLRAEDRPGFDFTFDASKRTDDTGTPWVAVKATIVPDRQGFRIQSQMVPVGALIASASDGGWQIGAFGQKTLVNIEWLVHQSEWTLDLKVESSQCEVVVKKNAEVFNQLGNDLPQRFEPCYTSKAPTVLVRAKFQGDVSDGEPVQRSLIYESPILERLAASMGQQQKIAIELGKKQAQQQSALDLKQRLASYQSEIEQAHRKHVEASERLLARLANYESKVVGWLPNRDDLRFSRDDADSVQR